MDARWRRLNLSRIFIDRVLPSVARDLSLSRWTPKSMTVRRSPADIVRLDNYLKYTARKHWAGDFTRVWVAASAERQRILGFYALNAHSLQGEQLPADLKRNAPLHGGIPAIYLSMIAVDRRDQGQGIGRILLADALNRSAAAADQIGLKAVVLDVIEDGGPEVAARRLAFYASMGFQQLPGYPARMFMAIETVRTAG